MENKRLWVDWLFVFSLLFIFRFTMLPHAGLGIGISKGGINLVPFKTISELFSFGHFPNWLINNGGNILLFVPFGFVLPLKFPMIRRPKTVVLMGLTFSLLIECIQLLMPNRWSDIDDVILNTLGTYIGFLLFQREMSAGEKKVSKQLK